MAAVIRRIRSVPSTRPEPAPPAPRTLSPEELRERLLRDRDRRVRGEVVAIFKEAGARVFSGDPLRSARGNAVGGAS